MEANMKIVTMPIQDLPNPMLDPSLAAENTRAVLLKEGESHKDGVIRQWDIKKLARQMHSTPMDEMFSEDRLVQILPKDQTTDSTFSIYDGNRRSCALHLLAEMYPKPVEAKRIRIVDGKAVEQKFIKDYSMVTVKVLPWMPKEELVSRRMETFSRRGLCKSDFNRTVMELFDAAPSMSEKDCLAMLSDEMLEAYSPGKSRDQAWREAIQNPRRMRLQPKFIQNLWLRASDKYDKEIVAPNNSGDIRDLNGTWKVVMELDKTGLFSSGLSNYRDLCEALKTCQSKRKSAKTDKTRDKYQGLVEAFQNYINVVDGIIDKNENPKGKGKGKGAAKSRSKTEIGNAVDDLRSTKSIGQYLMYWANKQKGYASDEMYALIRDFLAESARHFAEQDPEKFEQYHDALVDMVERANSKPEKEEETDD